VTLKAAPLSLVKGTSIKAIINAANLKGYNASYSNANNPNCTFETTPVAPPVVIRNLPPTTYNLVQIQIPTLTSNSDMGGYTVTMDSYHV
jgi:hypothetical protein